MKTPALRAVAASAGALAFSVTAAAAQPTGPRFEEISEAAGLDFVHSTRSFGDRHKAEVLEMFTDGGAAVAVGDFDGDGHDDLFLTDSGEGRPNRLMRNLFGDTGELRFEDVGAEAGVAGGNGPESIVADALWLDFDDDGRLDLLVSRFGTPLLYRQVEPGDPSGERSAPRFEEVSGAAGLTELANTIAAIAFDYDGDGWLDLLFGNYFRPLNLLDLETPYVLPEDLDDAHNGGGVTLWRNVPAEPGDEGARTGGRAFVNVTEEAGLAHHDGWSLDLGHGDLDNDGDQDVYVASDYGTDRLFLNRGDGTFTDATEEVLGFDTKKGMNVDMADYDRNGWLDVYVTNITDEYMRECNMLWHNAGDGTFLDLSSETGTCDSDWEWAAKFADFDNDGWEDLLVANGLRSAGEENYIPVLLEMIITPGVDFSDVNSYPDIGNRTWSGYQPQRLFHNRGDGTFRETAAEAGVDNVLDGRGLGVGDFDGDGRLDFYQSNAGQRGLLYRNVTPEAGHWIALRLEGAGAETGSNRRAIGARVTVTTAGDEIHLREVDCGNGYASQSSTRVHFGLGGDLGTADAIGRVEIRWPSGRVQVLEAEDGGSAVPIDAVTRIVEEVDAEDRETSPNPPNAVEEKVEEEEEEEEATEEEAEEQNKLDLEQRLRRHRNLGKALYENPATQYEAVGEFEKALELAPESARERVNLGLALLRAGRTEEGVEQLRRAQRQDPSIPHTWFNLGIASRRQSDYAEAIEQLQGMAERVPDEPITHYNLGVLYKLEGEPEKAQVHLERAAELAPRLAGPHFQLANTYRRAGRSEEARREMETFRKLKAAQDGDEDLEWSWYSEIYETIDPEPRPAPDAEPRFALRRLDPGPRFPPFRGLLVAEADGAPGPDVVAWSAEGVLFLGSPTPAEPRSSAGFSGLRDVRHVAAGDLDGDGRHELAVVSADGTLLLAVRDGGLEPVEPFVSAEAVKRAHDRALWLDYDHDSDQDLILFGPESALLRNDGDGTWTDKTDAFPFAALEGGGPVSDVVHVDLVADTQGIDVVVAQPGRPDAGGVLFRDLLGGRYEAEPLPDLPTGTRELLAADVDHDGWTDLVAGTESSVTVLRNRHRYEDHEGFDAVTVTEEAGVPLALLDLENRGAADLVAGGRLFVDLGGLRHRQIETPKGLERIAPETADVAATDLGGDGKTDLVAATTEGAVLLLENRTATDHGSLRISLEGVKSPSLAPGAEVEVKAGTLYQKKLYKGVPLVFGLAGHETADAVRITWPNGLIQNATRQPAGTSVTYEEAPRLSGSCPMVFTWNGERFQFITDVLGVAPLGAAAGENQYFHADDDEVIQIPGEALAETPEGRYEMRITEELREVGYLDRVRLLAVDHPAAVDVFTNDKFKGPPFPELLLFGVDGSRRRDPVTARDHRGRDVRERILARDARYVDGFERDDAGLAELHHLELEFTPERGTETAPGGRDALVLSGWVDWADGSTFLAAAQGDGPGLILPRLQVKDEAGEWVTVIEDMGIPAGKPKTIVVDLTGRWLSESREVRIVTSACVYWDEIFLGEGVLRCRPDGSDDPTDLACRPGRSELEGNDLARDPGGGASPIRLAEVPVVETDLRFRGFSAPVIHPRRLQPEVFVYADWRPTAPWDQTPGLYTRYGDVTELLAAVDDRFVVFGAGDEVSLSFDARTLPPLPAGWRRSFLLWVDGWAKDGDANTAHSQSVEPLPYHGMPGYPYEAPDGYPDDPEHRLYREEYLTRPALKLLRPLTEGTPEDPRRRGASPTGGER